MRSTSRYCDVRIVNCLAGAFINPAGYDLPGHARFPSVVWSLDVHAGPIFLLLHIASYPLLAKVINALNVRSERQSVSQPVILRQTSVSQ